jgi:hypothetical protein
LTISAAAGIARPAVGLAVASVSSPLPLAHELGRRLGRGRLDELLEPGGWSTLGTSSVRRPFSVLLSRIHISRPRASTSRRGLAVTEHGI